MSTTLEAPSGKNASGENFPVGSWLIRADLRKHIHTFYRFARTADDIADSPSLSAAEKVRRLDRMAAIVGGDAGDDAPAALAMRESLLATSLSPQHCLDLLIAFRQDATKLRYADWAELMEYCRYSAAPVGRQVLDLHGASRAAWPSSDALCSALQVLNHLQDCADDYRELDRVYIPTDALARAGGTIEDLRADRASPALRRTIDHLLDRTDDLIVQARPLPTLAGAAGLARETAIIVAIAEALSLRLRRQDPLNRRVKLGRLAFARAALRGLWRAMMARLGG